MKIDRSLDNEPRNVTISCPPELHKLIRRCAKHLGTDNRSRVIKQAIIFLDDHFAKKEARKRKGR